MARNSWLSFIPAALLAFAFFFAGQAKLTPLLTPDAHAAMLVKAPTWHTANPLLVPPPPTSLYIIGSVEVALALALLVPPFRRAASLVAVALMAGAVYNHVVLAEPITVAATLLTVASITWLVSGKPARMGGKKKQ